MSHYVFETENVLAEVNPETGIVCIIYRNILNATTTMQTYAWIAKATETFSVDALRGAIFDFRQVETFDHSNLNTTRSESRRVNDELDFSHVPVALIVETAYQESFVRMSMKITPQQDRKRVVHSMDGALHFIKKWHQQNNAADAAT